MDFGNDRGGKMIRTAVSIENVSFRYANGAEGALNDIRLDVRQGECILLCGSSGCGKTTVTRLLNGLIPHYYEGHLEGSVTVLDRNVKETAIEDLAGIVGSVFQNPRSQFFCVDTTAEIVFGCENMGIPEPEIRSRLKKTVADMQIENLLERSIFNLSGGEKQKIACAGVSAMQPELIVLDEPTSNLDLEAIEGLRKILQMWKAEGKTIVVAEHRLGWLNGICDRVLFMENGSIRKEYSGEAFFVIGDTALNQLGLRALHPKHNYLDSPTGLSQLKPFSGGKMLTLDHFIFRYGKKPALDIDRLELPQGAVIAVVGHNGAGKTTFTRCLCGIQKGFRGRVLTGNQILRPKDMMKRAYMVMQDVNHQLFAENVLDEVLLGSSDPGETGEQAALELLTQLNIAEFRSRHPMSLSGGQKQRTAIASALLAGKKLMVFDEPTSGLDFRSMESTSELLRTIGSDVTVLIVTHDMELIDRCCTHVLHLEGGRA